MGETVAVPENFLHDVYDSIQPGMKRVFYMGVSHPADGEIKIALKHRDIPEQLGEKFTKEFKDIYYITEEEIVEFLEKNKDVL